MIHALFYLEEGEARSSETMKKLYQNIRRHNPENSDLSYSRGRKPKSYKYFSTFKKLLSHKITYWIRKLLSS